MDGVSETPSTVVIPPQHAHTATVIFIHGLGQTNLTWKMVIAEVLAPELPNVQWILPHAPKRSVSLNQGHRRPSWFDIARLPPRPDESDEHGLSESVALIESLILSQVHAGIDSRRIVLVGFSQGAALSMTVALTTLYFLGGVVSLSGWIPPPARHMMHNASHLPVLWCHGTADKEIPISYADDAVAFLQNSIRIPPSKLQFRVYDDLDHTIHDNELNDIMLWLQRILK